jgi:hypothetical protein
MIAMMLTTLVAGSVIGLMVSQSRFTDRMRDGVIQLDQVRSATNFIGSELVELPRGGVAHAAPDSLTIRMPLAWGVVCGDLQRQDEGKMKDKIKTWKKWRKDKAKKEKEGKPIPPMPEFNDTAAVYFEPLHEAFGAPRPDGFGLSFGGLIWELYDASDWQTTGMVVDTAAYGACLGDVSNAAEGEQIYQQFNNLSAFVDSMPTDGALLYAYQYVSYYFKEAGDAGGAVLYRATDEGSQKLAWPFSPEAGFRYRLATGQEKSSVPSSGLTAIRAIQLRLPAQRKKQHRAATDTLEVHAWIRLHNSR